MAGVVAGMRAHGLYRPQPMAAQGVWPACEGLLGASAPCNRLQP